MFFVMLAISSPRQSNTDCCRRGRYTGWERRPSSQSASPCSSHRRNCKRTQRRCHRRSSTAYRCSPPSPDSTDRTEPGQSLRPGSRQSLCTIAGRWSLQKQPQGGGQEQRERISLERRSLLRKALNDFPQAGTINRKNSLLPMRSVCKTVDVFFFERV